MNTIKINARNSNSLNAQWNRISDGQKKCMSYNEIMGDILKDEAIRRMNLMKISTEVMRDFDDNGLQYMCNDLAVLWEVADFEKTKGVVAYAVLPGNGFVDVPFVDGESDWNQDITDLSNGQAISLRISLDENGIPKGRKIVTSNIDWNADGIFLAQ